MQSPARLTLSLALLPLLAAACDSGGGGGGPAALPPTTACTLTSLGQEVAYVDSSGSGTVSVQVEPSAPDVLAIIVNGQRYILLPPALALEPPEVQDFFLFHEFGHHFADHHHDYGVTSCKVAEYEADAYATRVMYAKYGAAPLATVTAWFATYGNQGDQTHRTKDERVLYIEEVLASVQSSGAPCPEIPVTDCVNAPLGTLWLQNTAPEAVQVYANGQPLGILGLGQQGQYLLPPSVYVIEVWGTILYPLLGYTFYGAGNYPIQNGEVTSI